MTPCLNELQKEYSMKTKVIALDWQWVTLRSWWQMNRNGHSSPVKHNSEDKPHKNLENQPYLDIFLWRIFRSPVFTSVFLFIHMILPIYFTHVWFRVDLIFALLMDIWWFCFGFGLWEWKTKKQVGFKERQTFLKIWFLTTFMKVIDIFENNIDHINLLNI